MDKKKIKKIAIITAVLLLPLIYSITYLKGFWDPYNNLGNIKVAIVNEDKCIKNCKGTDLIKKLRDSDTFDFIQSDKDEAEAGLLAKKYYATITIPSDFTSAYDNIDSLDRKAPVITYRTNKKTNYIASQLIENAIIRVEKELDSEVAKEIVKNLTDKLNEVPEKTDKMGDGLDKIYTGSVALNSGAVKLSNGSRLLSSNSKKITDGINDLDNGMSALKYGMTSLKSGVKELSLGSKTLKNGSNQILYSVNNSNSEFISMSDDLSTALQNLKGASTSLKNGATVYVALSNVVLNDFSKSLNGTITSSDTSKYSLTCNQLKDMDNDLGNLIKTLLAVKPELANKTILEVLPTLSGEITTGINALDSGASSLSSELTSALTTLGTNMQLLSQNLSTLNAGINKFDEGVNGNDGLVNSINRLDNGVKTIYEGTNKLGGSYKIFDGGINNLNDGASSLKEGIDKLSSGSLEMKNEVKKATDDTREKLSSLDELDKFTAKPVKLKDNSYGKVNDYGTFFSPFFMSLSLWLGGILIIVGLYYDPEKRFTILGKETTDRPKRLIYYTIIGIAQSIILPIVLVLALQFTVTNWLLFFGSCILIGLSFLSIMLFMVFNFDDIGKFLAIVLLVVQLAACAGTFPLETEPTFFGAISPIMPMTYSVDLLRESFVSIDSSLLIKDAAVLFGILIFFGSLILVTGYFKTKKEMVKAK